MTLAPDTQHVGSARGGRRYGVDEYLRLEEAGHFDHRRTELIDGEVHDVPPQKNDHVYAIWAMQERLREVVKGDMWLRTQATLKFPDLGVPEPDLAVVAGPPRGGAYYQESALFVVEVSETTLAFDRTVKASLYATAGVPEYWIVNLVDRCIEVRREPAETPAARFGRDYRVLQRFEADAQVPWPRELDADGGLRVADVLP